MSTETASRFFWIVVAIAAAAIIATGALLAKAIAHDWYPMECCSGLDCAPAKVEQIPTQQLATLGETLVPLPSMMRVSTQFGSVIVPANFTPRPSPDGQTHACIHNGKLLCLFLPPSM